MAQNGDVVKVDSDRSSVLGAAVLVYIVPVILFFVGYFLGVTFHGAESTAILLGGAGFVVGLLLAIAFDRYRKQRPTQFRIVSVQS